MNILDFSPNFPIEICTGLVRELGKHRENWIVPPENRNIYNVLWRNLLFRWKTISYIIQLGNYKKGDTLWKDFHIRP